jgi:four helix bundle protein
MKQDFRNLVVWQKAIAFVTEVYRATQSFPNEEKFGLTSQLRRASVSIPSNIAEGQGRLTRGEFRQFLGHAKGSICEVETQLIIAHNLGYLNDPQPLLVGREGNNARNSLASPLSGPSRGPCFQGDRDETCQGLEPIILHYFLRCPLGSETCSGFWS